MRGARRGDAQAPRGGLAGAARHQAGSWTAQLDRCSIKQKRKMIRPWFRQAAVPWKTTATQTRASGENRVSTKLGVLHAEQRGYLAQGDEPGGEQPLAAAG